jgi:RHS repeat-associated protein
VSQNGVAQLSYAYDALGRRTSKTVSSGAPTQFLYDGQNAVQETVGSAINPILIGPGIDERYARNDVGGRAYFLSDALNSTIALTSSTGAIQNQYSYDPYGNVTASNATFTNPYQFMGREADAPGLYYYRARYYSPMMAGFISEDPIGFAGGQLSFYAYVGGDPLDYTDPYGLWTFQIGFSFTYNLKIPYTPLGIAGSAGVGAAFDSTGQIAPYYYYGGGAGAGTSGADGGVQLAVSDANTVQDLAGPFANYSIDGGVGAGGNVDGFWGSDSTGCKVVRGGGVTIGGGGGAFIFSGITKTVVGTAGRLW